MAPNKDIVNYIHSMLEQNYEISAISQQLESQGFAKKDIETATDYVYATYYHKGDVKKSPDQYKTQPKHKIGTHEIGILVLIIFGVALIGLALIFVLSSPDTVEQPTIRQPVIDREPDAIVEEPVIEVPDEIILEDDEPVIDEPIAIDQPADDFVAGILDTRTEESISEPYNSNNNYNNRQIGLKVDYFKDVDPNEALLFCGEYTETKSQYCIIDVAVAARNENLCTQVASDSIRDDCYLELILSNIGDEETCDSIANAYKRASCKQLVSITDSGDSGIVVAERDPEDAINFFDVVQ